MPNTLNLIELGNRDSPTQLLEGTMALGHGIGRERAKELRLLVL